MSNKIKKVLICLTIIGASLGFFGKPKVSEAATINIPALTTYVEFVDFKGEELPVNMELKASHMRVYGATKDLSITKTVGKNHFGLNIPAFNETIGAFGSSREMVTSVVINNPMPYVKKFTLDPPSGSLPRKASERIQDSYSTPIVDNDFVFKRLADNRWHIDRDQHNSVWTGVATGGVYFSMFSGRNFSADYSGNILANSSFSDIDGTIRFYVLFNQVKEIFEDESGATIPAPSGYTNGNAIDIVDQPFNYQMTNDSSLPKTYKDAGYTYTYKGWYKGNGNKNNLVTTHPPSISFNATLTEPENEVHIVYSKKLTRFVKGEYVDTNSAIIDPSWNTTQSVLDGSTYTSPPNSTLKYDSSGVVWEYQGWKLGSEPMSAMRPSSTPVSVLIDANKTIQYVYKKKEHTMIEKWVDQADGSTLVPMAGNPKTSPIDDNDNFTGSATTTITDTGGGIWDFVGWENVTDAPGTMNPSSSPQVVNNIKGSKEIRYHYQARNTTATLDLNPTPQVTASGGNVSWSSRLTNTGTSTLNNLKLKATSNWAAGLSAPTQVTVTPAGGSSQNFTVSPGDWTSGFNLTGINIPNAGPNNYADITFTDTATGSVNQVLPAEIEIDGNMASPLTAENFVRIDDPDEPNLEPSGNAGLINIPDFRFGDVEVKPFAQTKGLDTTAYQSGYNPYIRFMDNESTGGWSLTAKLGQFTSGSKTLPTTTAIKLKNGVLMEVQNYNKSNENLSYVDLAGSVNIPSDGTTVALTNKSNQGVYQLEYGINSVELELMAHSGIAGLSYTADMDWTLTTAP